MPKGALYLFPKLDPRRYNIRDDEKFAFDLLRQEKLLVVQGTGFNWPEPDHFRIDFIGFLFGGILYPREAVDASGKAAR